MDVSSFCRTLVSAPPPRKRIVWRLKKFQTAIVARALAFVGRIADMGAGGWLVDDPLANRVRSGRKQP